jgi:hypothetical protein
MTDRTTKALLLAIAVGVWLNLVGQWVAHADINDATRLVRVISDGRCRNSTIC